MGTASRRPSNAGWWTTSTPGQGWSTAATAAAPKPHVDPATYAVSSTLAAGMRLAREIVGKPPHPEAGDGAARTVM